MHDKKRSLRVSACQKHSVGDAEEGHRGKVDTPRMAGITCDHISGLQACGVGGAGPLVSASGGSGAATSGWSTWARYWPTRSKSLCRSPSSEPLWRAAAGW